MIQSFVGAIKDSLLLKAFLGIVMLSFGVWGVGDVLSPGMDPSIAITVNKTDISAEELGRRVNQAMDRIKQSVKDKRTLPDDLRRTVVAETAEDMTRVITADVAARDMGIVVTKERLRETVRQQAAFKDASGTFNQMQYTQILADNRLTEKAFIAMVMSDIHRQTILVPVTKNAAAPAPLIDALTSYRGETRIADTLLISADSVPLPDAPTDEALKKIYDDNIATFTAPEYRKITALTVRATDLVTPDSLDPEQLKAYYDENIARYRDPEKHRLSQIVFESKEQADAARAQLPAGGHLEDIAKKANTSAPVDLGELGRTDPLAKMIGAAYDLPVGQVSDVIQTDLGWHLFEVTSVKSEQTVPFNVVEGQIRTALAEEKGTDALYEASTTLDDGLAGGTPLEELAAKVGGHIVHIDAVDQQGRDPRGLDAPGLFDNAHFLQNAFSTPAGTTSRLLELPKGYYVLAVDSVTPPAPRPLNDVRKDVIALWEKQARTAAAKEIAAKTARDVGPSVALADMAAKNRNLSYAQLGPLTRFGEGLEKAHIIDTKRVSPDLLGKLFSAKTGDVITAAVAGGAIVARLREIIPPADAGDTAVLREQIAKAVKDGIGNDLVDEVSAAFAERYPARVNKAALDQLAATSAN